MKRLALYCIFLLSFFVNAQESAVWTTDLDLAMEKARSEKKPILIYFTGSDWCAPCKMLKEDVFSTEKFREQSKSFILVEIDTPRRVDIISEEQRKVNIKINKKYNRERSYPNLVVLNHKGRVIAEKSGYTLMRDPSYHFNFLDNIIKK